MIESARRLLLSKSGAQGCDCTVVTKMDEKLQVLEQVPLLASLGEELMKDLAAGGEIVAFKKGDLVVREDDPGDALYAVISGRLQAYTRLGSGHERVFTTYSNGDYFGEMPLLSGETHWCNVRTLNDSILLKIPRELFDAVLRRDPRVAASVLGRMGHRIKELRAEKYRAKCSTIISLFSALPGTGKTTLATNLVASLVRETHEPVLLLDFSGRRSAAPLTRRDRLSSGNGHALEESVVHTPHGYDRLDLELGQDAADAEKIAPLFGRVVKQYDYVLVDLPNRVSRSVFSCLLQSDQIYVVTKNEAESLGQTRELLRDLEKHAVSVMPKAKLILTSVQELGTPRVEEAERKLGQQIAYVLARIPEADIQPEQGNESPYVVRRPMEAYSFVVRRMARELGNVLVGLALGSGAARGLAHIGAIRVLEREKIAVDVVAGSSMGALIAAAWATGKSADEMEEIALRVKGRRAFLKLLDPMFPGSGIIRGLKITDFLYSIVDDLTFGDTVIPLKIVASDLNTMEEVVFEQGKLIDAIRASISIPGVFRPVLNDSRTLIDGGITNPVPVSVLARAGVSRIIAINTIPNIDEMKERERCRAELRRATGGIVTKAVRETGALVDTPTSIINIYMRSMHAMQSRMAEQACVEADIVIRPIPRESVWYDFYHPDRYIRCGEEAATAVLPRLKELVPA